MAEETKEQEKMAEDWEEALSEQQEAEPQDAAEGGEAPEQEAEGPAEEDMEAMLGDTGTESASEGGDEALAEEWAAALAAEEGDKLQDEKKKQSFASDTQEVQFKDLTAEAKAPRQDVKRDLDFILDIPLEVSAELGRTRLLVNELLQLGQGSVIELNKLAGEPLEIYVNGKLVARGEAVVINEKFGVRLTDIISPIERVKQLG